VLPRSVNERLLARREGRGAMRVKAIALALALWAVGAAVAAAQVPYVPAEFLSGHRRLQGNSITFCVYEDSPTYAFDRAVAEELAMALLLEPNFFEVKPPPFRLAQEDYVEELYVLLMDHCDAMVGFSLATDTYPDWLVLTRPYYWTPYVLAVTDPDYRQLSDIPRDKAIGTRLLTLSDVEFINFMSTLPKEQRWRRFPYVSDALLVQRLLDGTIAGALMWAPALYRETGGNPEALGIRVISTSPLRTIERPVGLAVRSSDAFLRAMLDEAIAALTQDGIIDELLERTGTLGRPDR